MSGDIPVLDPNLGLKNWVISEPKPIPGQLGYFPSKSGQVWTDTHTYGFHCHA